MYLAIFRLEKGLQSTIGNKEANKKKHPKLDMLSQKETIRHELINFAT